MIEPEVETLIYSVEVFFFVWDLFEDVVCEDEVSEHSPFTESVDLIVDVILILQVLDDSPILFVQEVIIFVS